VTDDRTGGKGAPVLEAPHRRREQLRTVSPAARIIEPLGYHAYRAGSWIVCRIPDRIAWSLVGTAMVAGAMLWPKKRRWSEENYAHVLGVEPGHPRARRMARRQYMHYGRYVVEIMKLPSLPRERVRRMVSSQSADSLEGVWKASNGVIIVATHLANNEAGITGCDGRGWPLSAVADDTAYSGIFSILEELRGMWGVKIVPWRNLREVFKVLRRKEFLILLIDWGYREDGIPVKWFGSWTRLPAGPAVLAGKTGASIVPVFMRREGDWQFVAEHGEPILVPSTEPREVLHATQKMADALEAWIRTAPDQWYVFKPHWPTTKEEEERIAAEAAAIEAGTAGLPQMADAGAASAPAASTAGASE
jgi:lauroyl/myristoyl acyltransferase